MVEAAAGTPRLSGRMTPKCVVAACHLQGLLSHREQERALPHSGIGRDPPGGLRVGCRSGGLSSVLELCS